MIPVRHKPKRCIDRIADKTREDYGWFSPHSIVRFGMRVAILTVKTTFGALISFLWSFYSGYVSLEE
jgi:hypothetical protein